MCHRFAAYLMLCPKSKLFTYFVIEYKVITVCLPFGCKL